MEKPRIKYGTVAWMIERFITESNQPGGKPLMGSHLYTLKRMKIAPLGAVAHLALKPLDFIDHCKARKAKGIKPPTINHDMNAVSGVLRHAVEVWEMPDHGLEMYRKAKPLLKRQQLVSKSQPRDRRPTIDELDQLYALALKEDARPKNKILMAPIVKFQYLSARRIGETCRLRRGDVDLENRTCLVRDLKNPKGKGFHGRFPLLGEAWDIVVERLKVIPDDPDARLFPYISASVQAKYIAMKHTLGIKGLRLHDSRREAISRLFEQGYGVPEVAQVSLHRNPTQLLGTYTRLKPESLHAGPAAKRAA